MQSLLDLILPRECGGCSTPGTTWCTDCRDELDTVPVRLNPRVDVGVPSWSLGDYSGPRRGAVVAAKERGRRDLAVPLGHAVARAVLALRDTGELDPWQLSPLHLIPAPTRRRAARTRGGDPVERMCRATAAYLGAVRYPEGEREIVEVSAVVAHGRGVRDSVGLSARERRINVAGRIHVADFPVPAGGATVVVDDVLTTGTTAAETVRALRERGLIVDAVLVVASVT